MQKINDNWRLVSMTGAGRASLLSDDLQIDVFIRSINHKILDCRIISQDNLSKYENDILKLLKSSLIRGAVQCYVEIVPLKKRCIIIDEEKILNLVNNYEELSKKHSFLNKSVTLTDLLFSQNLVNLGTYLTLDNDDIKKIFMVLTKAIEDLHKSREKEGELLSVCINNLLSNINKNLTLIKNTGNDSLSNRFDNIKLKVLEILKNCELDEQRMYQEAALLTQKSDFTEELERLFSHVEHFNEICEISSVKGRKLDFICQEMLREVNTMLSKAFCSHIIKIAIDLKSCVENLREQVQNIE